MGRAAHDALSLAAPNMPRMIIWRGWGIVGFLLILGGDILTTSGSGHIGTNTPAGMIAMGAGFALGGAACAVFGYRLNVLRPRQKAEEYLQGLRQDLWQRMREGTFQVPAGAPAPSEPAGAPAHSEPAGAPAPRDEAEASQQIERIVAQQSPEVRRRLRNRNTLFFIPLQWLGSVVVIGGVVLLILGAAGRSL